jgi:uncharacterized protein YgiM (DUF1202 family)
MRISRTVLRGWKGRRTAFPLVLAVFCLVFGAGCSRLRPHPAAQYVYVTAKQTFLRDRVAAVSNRTATVANGDRLEVLEHGRRFYRVKTATGEVGWIDEKAVATQAVFDAFEQLAREHKGDPAVASAVVKDDVNVHVKPGRETERFYRLAENDKLELLERATLPKPGPGAVAAKPVPKTVSTAAQGPKSGEGTAPMSAPVPMEDWWLVRDEKGRVGWLLSRAVDVDAPSLLTKYAEGQRFVGAYVLETVHDDGANGDDVPADKNIPVYLALMGPYTAGLPYDFDQVRVFTWSLKMHRYETAFREKNIEGYLPVERKRATDPYGKGALAQTPEPTFTYRVLAEDAPAVVPDAATGVSKPGRLIAKTYRVEGNLVRRVAPAGFKDEPEAHPVAVEKKDKKEKKGKKK